MTLVGSDAAVLLSDNDTTVPAAGAGPVSTTVPVEVVPPVTLVGARESEVSTGRVTVKVADFVVPLRTAEMLTFVFAATGTDATANVAVVVPS